MNETDVLFFAVIASALLVVSWLWYDRRQAKRHTRRSHGQWNR